MSNNSSKDSNNTPKENNTNESFTLQKPLVKVTDPKQLTTVYKKNGTFDNQRKQLLENFKSSETYNNLLLKLTIMIESKIKNDPQLLLKNKGKIAALIQGEIIQNSNNELNILSIVDKDIQDKIIESRNFHEILKDELMNIQRKIMGINDEEFNKIKENIKLTNLKLEKEKSLKKLKYEQELKNLEYRDNFVKNLNNINSSKNRINKIKPDEKLEIKKEEKKKKKMITDISSFDTATYTINDDLEQATKSVYASVSIEREQITSISTHILESQTRRTTYTTNMDEKELTSTSSIEK
ncbi:uncharacterized protein KGF55_000673 [Candida pseudojiufengensis]|uniref:uncharacterized protein n=1 Tax=Candida pseudojiufengensis TaxID=497109 RepID=UPI002224D045|nr:uncharacterized protein KGF55_000673 [Candida pseudojiufengensis]KAI5966364.1 hypothetical protein KGF55_000673 [Candida pseudojiufengensis]